jgi:hypothetical protein
MEKTSGEPVKRPTAGNWMLGLALIAVGALFLVGQYVDLGDLIWSLSMGVVSAAFLFVFLLNRTRWWALIPAYIFGLVAVFLLIEPGLSGDWDGVFWVFAVALPFLIVFITNPRERWWALIPTYVLSVSGVFILLEDAIGTGDNAGTFWMFAIAAPFVFVFLTNPRERWWALIPGGIMLAIGIGLWVQTVELLVAIVLIGIGILLLARQFLGGPRKPPAPTTGPEADRPSQ